MDRDFEIRHLSVWEGSSAVHDLDLVPEASPFDDDDLAPPWFELGVFIETDSGAFTLHVEVMNDWLRHRQYQSSTRRYYEQLDMPGAPSLYLAPWDEPSVLVDAEYFAWPFVECLLHSPPAVRRRILWPRQYSQNEVAVLLDLETQYTADEALCHAIEVLEEKFGKPLRIGVQEAREAADLVRAATFLREPQLLWNARRDVFSPAGRRAFTTRWSTPEPF